MVLTGTPGPVPRCEVCNLTLRDHYLRFTPNSEDHEFVLTYGDGAPAPLPTPPCCDPDDPWHQRGHRRHEFGSYLTSHGYRTGIEIGTREGEFAETLLRGWPGVLHCIDPWTEQPDYDENESAEIFEAQYVTTLNRLAPWIDEGRCVVHRMTGQQAALESWSTADFVYIDARHHYEGVKDDIDTWANRAARLLCGHDYFNSTTRNFWVKRAVNEWSSGERLCVGSETHPSWFVTL